MLTKNLAQRGIVLDEYDIDDPKTKPLMERYNIRSVPTIVVDDDGLIKHFVGPNVTNLLVEALS